MMHDGAASPAPDHTRRVGSGLEGPVDRTEERSVVPAWCDPFSLAWIPLVSPSPPPPPPLTPVSRCRHCGFLVAEKSGGLACKSGETCPFYGKEIEYLAPPLPRSHRRSGSVDGSSGKTSDKTP
jgi:hypothetical protein